MILVLRFYHLNQIFDDVGLHIWLVNALDFARGLNEFC